MSTKQIEQVMHRQPFEPFVLRLKSGQEVFVEKPKKAHISGPYLACAGVGRGGKKNNNILRLWLIPLTDVVAVDNIAV